MEKLVITGLNINAVSGLNSVSLTTGAASKLKDKSINRMIDLHIEEMKRERYLTPMIRELDIQELKKLDAVLHRGEAPTSLTAITPVDLSEKAVNLYVAIVKGAFTKTVDTCCELYTSDELVNLAKTKQTLTDELLQGNGNKQKKFDAAQKALISLRNSSTSKESISTEKLLAK